MDSLSALLDGECSPEEMDRLLAEIDRSPELAQRWSRLCMARDAQAGVKVKLDQVCICDGVMSRLDDAPATADSKVVDLAVRKAERVGAVSRARMMPAAWKPLAGFAAAASMGAAAVFFLQPQAGSEGANGEAPARGIPVAGTLAHWTQGQPAVVQPVVLNGDEAHNQMLQEYLMDHSSAVAGEGFGSTLRYARFAAHTADYRNGSGE